MTEDKVTGKRNYNRKKGKVKSTIETAGDIVNEGLSAGDVGGAIVSTCIVIGALALVTSLCCSAANSVDGLIAGDNA